MNKRLTWVVWIGVALMAATLLVVYSMQRLSARSQQDDPLRVIGPVADFTLTNQNDQAVTLANLRGHVWVADIIFSRCAGPCLKMSRQMEQLQQALPANSQAKLVTLTTDPTYDTPAVLKTYSEKFGANPNRWQFLTGSKKQIADLAVGSLKLTAVEKEPQQRQSEADLFIHSTIFVVADKQGRLRGVFETTGDGIEPAQVKQQILEAVNRLERE